MALNAGTVSASADLNNAKFMAGLGDMKRQGERASKDISRRFERMGATLQNVGGQLSKYITLPLVGAGTLAIKTAADYERLQVQINTLAGSAEEGAKAFKQLQDFSAGTPFQLADLAKANNILVGMGRTMSDAFTDIQMLGDVASATGANINELAITFGQASAEGKLMTRDIREFINRGVPLTKLLAESMGVAKNEIFDLASQGKISFDVMRKAIEDATSETGIYANATEKAADTIHGVLSTLKDNATRLLSEIGNSLVETFDLKNLVRDLTSSIQESIKWFNSLSSEVRKKGFIIAGILGAAGPIITALGVLSASFAAISAPVLGVVAGIGVAATLIIKNWDKVSEYFTSGGGAQMWIELKDTANSVMNSLKNIIADATDLILGIWDEFGNSISSTFEASFSVVLKTVEFTFGRIEALMGILNNNVEAELNIFEDNWITTLDKVNQHINAFVWDKFVLGGLKGFNVIDTEFDKLRKEFESRGLELPDFGLIVDEKELAQMREFISKVKSIESLDLAKAQEFNKMMDEISERDMVIHPDIDLGSFDIGAKINNAISRSGISTPIKIPDNTPIEMPDLDFKDLAIGNMIAMEGSLVAVNNEMSRLMNLQSHLPQGTQAWQDYQDQIDALKAKYPELTNTAQQSGQAMMGLANSVGQVFSQAVLHAQNLEDVLTNLLKQLASKAFVLGLGALIAGPTATFGKGGSFLKSLFGGTFHSGGMVPGTGDKMIMAKGGEMVLTESQQRALSGSMNSGGGVSSTAIARAVGAELDKRIRSVSDRKIFEMAEQGRYS